MLATEILGLSVEIITLITGILAIGAVVYKGSRKYFTRQRVYEQMEDVIVGDKDAGRPPLVEWMVNMDNTVHELVRRVSPNGGNSPYVGDLMIKIAHRMGIDVPGIQPDGTVAHEDEEEHEPNPT